MAGHRAVTAASILSVFAWSVLVLTGFALLMDYGNTPGEAAAAPPDWPGASAIERDPERPTLVMFAHPRCPCSSASLEELDRLLARVGRDVVTTIVFVKESGAAEGWERTELWEAARRIPSVRVIVDSGGEEARRFRARTSGTVVVYDAGGRLLFSGGVTAARGHAGDNAGRSAIESSLAGDGAGSATAPVFGCPLDSPSSSQSDSACPR